MITLFLLLGLFAGLSKYGMKKVLCLTKDEAFEYLKKDLKK